MTHLYTIGETVYDIIFESGGKIRHAVPGGSMLNTSVSLGRLKLPVKLITEIGHDKVGSIILKFLKQNNVNTRYISVFDSGKTAISVAFLNRYKDAEYAFYKAYPEKRLTLPMPALTSKDYLLFGSFFSLQKDIRDPLIRFVRKSAGNGALILYDPNIRSPHKNQINELLPLIEENISHANIIRASNEDFKTIFNIEQPDDVYLKVKTLGCNYLILTSSNKGVYLFTPELKKFYNVREINPVSTIGAGDSFNAGILYSLFQKNIQQNELFNLKSINWQEMINIGIDFATNVCLSEENYISTSFAGSLNI